MKKYFLKNKILGDWIWFILVRNVTFAKIFEVIFSFYFCSITGTSICSNNLIFKHVTSACMFLSLLYIFLALLCLCLIVFTRPFIICPCHWHALFFWFNYSLKPSNIFHLSVFWYTINCSRQKFSVPIKFLDKEC